MSLQLASTPSVTAGSLLKRSFAVWMKNFVPFTILYALFTWPSALPLVSDIRLFSGHPRYAAILGLLLGNIAAGAMAYGVFMQLRGQRVGTGQSIVFGLRSLLPVLGVGLLVAVVVGLASTIAWGVPGLVLQLFFFVAVPAAVVEKSSLLEALVRSKQLTDDYKVTIFGTLMLITLATYAFSFAVGALVRWGIPAPSSSDKMHQAQIVLRSVTLVFGAWYSVAAAVAYHDLRVHKDGVGTEEIAKVFD